MPSLSDKLKALGVKVGAQGLPPHPQPAASPAPGLPSAAEAGAPPTLEAVLGGGRRANPLGACYVVEARYPDGAPHGQARLGLRPQRPGLAAWAGNPRLAGLPAEAFAFLDTETTGLSGGTGTLAFLIGAGRFIDGEFVLLQFFLNDPLDEPGQLAALEQFLAPCQAIVTFNGKSFDAPLLVTRYTQHGWRAPLLDLAHLDLLHLARRLWRERLPSRTLGNLEVQILGALRSGDDIPGWAIPQMYADYLRSGDPTPLRQVFYHNAMDVLSLAALMDHMAVLLDEPLALGGRFGIDLLSLARLFEDLGQLDQAARLYLYGLAHEDAQNERIPRPLLAGALHRLAGIHRRQGDLPAAMGLWEQAARQGDLQACVELAKCCEHSLRDPHAALRWTSAALQLVDAASPRPADPTYLGLYERRRWTAELGHRRDRLIKKTHAKPTDPPPEA
ncbi:MAG: ribonuclease H-like domain-containing protein [Chloroflexota bacterium]